MSLFIILSLWSGAVNAQADESPAERKIPSLNGHKFPSLSYLKSSFVSTSLQADLGFGITSPIALPGIEIGDYEIRGFKGQLLFY